MKHTFLKGMGLAMAAALTLTGCNLIEVDEVMQANEEITKINTAYAVNVATYNGGEVTAAETIADFNTQYSNMAYMYYYYFGMNIGAEEMNGIAQDTIEAKVEEEIVAKHFDEAGMTLTEEQLAEVQAHADEDYEAIHAQALNEATGKKDTYKEANAQVLLTRVGQTQEQIATSHIQAAKADAMKQALLDEVTEVTDDELQAAYEAQVESDRAKYDADPASYGPAVSAGNTVVAYAPEGYRTVRHILAIPEETVLTAYTDATSALSAAETELSDLQDELAELESAEDTAEMRSADEINADIAAKQAEITEKTAAVDAARAACLENVSEKTTAIYAALEEGKSFEEVMNEFGEDPGMKDAANAATGYYVCAASTVWQKEFTEGAMALANVGDYSAVPVVSGSGVHIIEYYKAIPAGPIALADIHDALYAQTLENMKNTHRDETIAAWVAEAAPTYDAAALITVATAA